ncbi:MAG: S-layer homology domain-containing protein [Thermacetogeniaceae bacterium]
MLGCKQVRQQELRLGLIMMLTVLSVLMFSTRASATAFTDLQNHWSYQAVVRDATLDLIKGYPSGQFMPDRPVSLLESVVLLSKTCGSAPGSRQNAGTAASPAHSAIQVPWGQPYIDSAVANDIIPEDLSSTFDPDAPATRGQVAVMLCRLLQLPVSGLSATNSALTDLSAAPPAYVPYIAAIYEAGLIKGYSDGSFGPQKSITRGEMAAIIARLIDLSWAELPANRRAEGWIRSSSSGKKAQVLELVSLQGAKTINLSPTITYFAGGKECSLQDIIGDRVELLLDSANQVACVSMLEERPQASQNETVRGTIKAVALGVESYLVISDLQCQERNFPIAWDAVIESNNKNQTVGFQSLQAGAYIDISLADGKVTKVVPLVTKQISAKVQSFSGGRLMLSAKVSKSQPGWFNNWDSARVVDSNGNYFGGVQVGDSIKVTYLDPDPNQIDDEIPLEIAVTSRPTSKS